ncbi:response regulator transcription factor [Sciscionella sediminilitoris]|uniref:response regulator transcription factor n=1 Tax=Sciscionella sediminilitoris TaxID=1445613 RepID=UPI0004DEFA48|nr:response regulator transcription factor [Sciscionella sp. SE31]
MERVTIKVLIVDDDALVRAGLVMMLDGAGGITVVGEAADGDEAITAVGEHAPDVVLMDLRMPRMNGVEATERLRSRDEPPEILVLTTFDTDDNVLAALRAGAGGFLVKDSSPTQIVEAITQVATGEAALSPKITRQLMDRVVAKSGTQERAREALRALSAREREVAFAIAEGGSNAEIAATLYMSVATVKAHITQILTKLKVDNRTQLALLVHDSDLA